MTSEPVLQPLPSNAATFAYDFVSRMRLEKDIKTHPSIRQTQAIPKVLSARFFRNGKLTLDDFIDAAVVTTYPPDQALARLIAEDVLFGRSRADKKPPQKAVSEQTSPPNADAIQRVVEQIRREQELGRTIKSDKVEAGYNYLQDLKSRAAAKALYEAAVGKRDAHPYLTDGDVVLRGITSDDELREVAGRELKSRSGNLTPHDISSSKILGALNELCTASNAAERLAAKALRGDPDVEKEFSDLATRDPATAAKALSFMEQLGVPNDQSRARMDRILQDALKDLSDAAAYARALDRMPDRIDDLVRQAPSQYNLSDAMETAKSISTHGRPDLPNDVLDQYDAQYDRGASSRVDMKQLALNANPVASWESLLEKKTRDIVQDARARSNPADFLRHVVDEMSKLSSELPDERTRNQWDEAMQKIADAAVSHAQTKSHLRHTVRELTKKGVIPSRDAIEKAGQRLGMSEEEILELISPNVQVIKKLIQQGVRNFDRLHSLMASANLTHEQLREIADMAAAAGNQEALGAVAHIDLHAALGTSSPSGRRSRGYGVPVPTAPDPNRADMALGGLLGGPATNVIKIWYTYRDELPDDVRRKLREIASRLLIDLGSRFAKTTMGSSMLGGIQESTTVRPFRIGDETDLISLEETIDHLLSQGRTSFDVVNTEDFLMVETYQGHRAFYWALDKSGSMDAAEKLGMLSVSVMAGIFGVQKDDFGVVLFDSQTHIVKEMQNNKVSVDKVAADLLDVRAGGGTGGYHSMSLAIESLKFSRAKEKFFVLSTDMFLSDQVECVGLARQMRQLDIKVMIIVPRSSYNGQAADELARAAHGVVLDIAAIDELPERLLRLTNY